MQRDARKTLIALEFKRKFADLSAVDIWGKTRFSAPVLPVLCLLSLLVFTAAAQTKLTLQQVGSRTGRDFVPTYEGQQALVRGQVYTQPIWIADSYYLPIQDEAHYGLLLRTSSSLFQGFSPGDWVEAQGVVANRAGLPILVPQTVRRLRHTPPPTPLAVTASDLASFRYMGALITTEDIVTDEDQNGGGDLLLIGARSQALHVFLPRARRDSGPKLTGFRIGDRIRVTGVASQYCTLPPFDRFFQVLIASPSSVSVIERGWVIQPPFLLAALILAGALALIWWFREQHMAGLRKQMRLLNSLGEQVIGATSSTEILRRLTVNLPALSNASGVGLYIHNRATKLLEGIHTSNSAVDSPSIPRLQAVPWPPASQPASVATPCWPFRIRAAARIFAARKPRYRRARCCSSPCSRKPN